MEIRTNSAHAWLLAARPKTLTGAAVPVLVALCAAWSSVPQDFDWLPALLCMAFALLMQVDANLVNDYFDWADGVDTAERLGPERAVAQGWVTPRAMRIAIVLTTLASAATGLPLVMWGGWYLVWIGMACIAGCFLYTTLFSRHALGDVLVFLFFGIVPVCATYYIQRHELTTNVVMLATACGMVVDCLLIINNYRDRETDARVGKATLATLIGATPTEAIYLAIGFVATGLTIPALGTEVVLMLPYLALHTTNWRQMHRIHKGRALNKVLATTSMAILLFGLSLSILLLLQL
ncbi:MAG: 1,4-dihydroxy-2-naphthoate octaprenyltransferase [Bacteroidaceae bacterium]|nr:1,4-dihydroxy-2-naphthoate octaprenyltransferase [Bacteroidaceae bacterium]